MKANCAYSTTTIYSADRKSQYCFVVVPTNMVSFSCPPSKYRWYTDYINKLNESGITTSGTADHGTCGTCGTCETQYFNFSTSKTLLLKQFK